MLYCTRKNTFTYCICVLLINGQLRQQIFGRKESLALHTVRTQYRRLDGKKQRTKTFLPHQQTHNLNARARTHILNHVGKKYKKLYQPCMNTQSPIGTIEQNDLEHLQQRIGFVKENQYKDHLTFFKKHGNNRDSMQHPFGNCNKVTLNQMIAEQHLFKILSNQTF